MAWEQFRDALKDNNADILEKVCSYDCVVGMNEL
jgi:hypothetical protein